MLSFESLRRLLITGFRETYDLIAGIFIFLCAHFIVIGNNIHLYNATILVRLIIFSILYAFVIYQNSLNNRSWRYISIHDLNSIVVNVTIFVLFYAVIIFIIEGGSDFPESIFVILIPLLVFAFAVPRVLYRIYCERGLKKMWDLGPDSSHQPEYRNLLVFTVNDHSEAFIRMARRGSLRSYRIVGIVDERPNYRSETIHGVRVLGTIDELGMIVARLARGGCIVSEIAVAAQKLQPSQLEAIISKAVDYNIKVKMIPNLNFLADFDQKTELILDEIDVGLLLDRKEIKVDSKLFHNFISSKTILISGAAGSIGSELVRQVASFLPDLIILTDNNEHRLYELDREMKFHFPTVATLHYILDVRDQGRVETIFKKFKPQIVFHAAALKHVPMVETNPLEGIKTNALGTQVMADNAIRFGAAAFVMISTDKAVNPASILGATKRAAEVYCQALDISSITTRLETVRFGNVLGSNGSVVPLFREQINRGGPVTVTHPDVVRFFMSIPEAVRLVLQASADSLLDQGSRGNILALDMGNPVRILDLANKMITMAGLRPGIDIAVRIIGLRAGEKLFEELFNEGETFVKKSNGYIAASTKPLNAGLVEKTFRDLRKACEAENEELALELLRQIVPEYRPGAIKPGGSEVIKFTGRRKNA